MSNDPTEIEMLEALRPVVSVLDSLTVRYLVGGSVASSVYGDPRATRDVDIVADLHSGHASTLAGDLSKEFYADLPTISAAIKRRGSFNLIHLDTMVKIDVFVAKPTPFGESQLSRRRLQTIGQSETLEIHLASPEDTVLAKLDWYRKGGGVSDRQWNDILGVLKVQAERLDRDYLELWALELSVTDLLNRALDDAGLN